MLPGTRQGPKRLTEGSVFLDKIYEVCFFLLFVGYFLFYDIRSLQFSFVCIGIAGSFIAFVSKIRLGLWKTALNTLWYTLFFMLAEFSSMWAVSPENATEKYLRLMLILIFIGVGIAQYVDTVVGAERILKIFLWAVVIITIVQFIFTPVESWTTGYFGSEVGGNNTNHFGYIVSMAAMVSFYFAYIKNQRFYYLTVALLFVASIFSSSRKSLGIFVAGILLLILLATKKKHHILHLAIVGIVAFSFLILIIENETMYEIVGYRFESLFGHLSGEASEQENSIVMREYFIEFAKILFLEKPIIGHGFFNFSVLVSLENEVKNQVYAHNNYWELLADLGIVGFITYYWFYAYLFIRLAVRFFKEKDNTLPALGLTMLISQLVLEWGVVSMTLFHAQIVISLIYACSYASNSRRAFRYAPEQLVR